MQFITNHLAAFQFLAVFYCTLIVGTIQKAVRALGEPAEQTLANLLHSYGFLLLLLPAAWHIWARISEHRSRIEAAKEKPVVLYGLIILGILVCLAIFGTVSALSQRPFGMHSHD